MPNKFYDLGTQRAAKVRDLFASIAHRYDLINDLQSFGLHRHWKRRLLRLAGDRASRRVLDLCCGTGDIAFQFAARGATVLAADFSPAMLDIARARARNEGASIEFVEADALNLPFSASQFDVVTVGYGLRNLADPKDGLGEMHRVVKPGGCVLILEFGKPRNGLLRRAYFAYLRFWVPVFGRVFCRDAAAYEYILESLNHYPGQEGVAVLMKELGFVHIRIFNLLGGMMSINYGERALESNMATRDVP